MLYNPGLHQNGVNKMVALSNNNSLEINTKEMEVVVFSSPSDYHKVPIVIHNGKIKQVFSYKYLGVMTDHLLC